MTSINGGTPKPLRSSIFKVKRSLAGCGPKTNLEDALAAARDRETFVLIELRMSRLDAPGPLVNFAQRCAEFNFPSSARFDNPAHEESSEAPQQRLSGVQSRRPSEAIGQRAYNSQKADH
jgi:hypothetical protein